MKKIVLSLALFTVLSATGFAQGRGHASEVKSRPHMRELNLTDEQEKQMDDLRDKYRAKKEELDADFKDEMKKILTSEQLTTLESIERNRPTSGKKGDNRNQFNTNNRGKHKGRGHKDGQDLDNNSKQKLADLRKDYDEKKAAIEKSRVAPDTQKEQLKALRTKYSTDVQNVLDANKKNEEMECPHSVQAWMDIAPL